MLGNIIHNSIKHTPEDGNIDVNLKLGDHQYAISVLDNGTGILDTDLPAIFDRFYRTKNSRQAGISGMGIGLYITKTIMEAHGRNKGTTVKLYLPC